MTWNEFDFSVQHITSACRSKSLSGVYGFPRGGLCLAVALSHALRIPFLTKPKPYSLVVDDVCETGLTLNNVKDIPGITTFVWLSKREPDWWNAVEVCNSSEWLLFPWENIDFARIDQEVFGMKRGK
ncbi:putative PURINE PHOSPHORIBOSYLTRANSFERASE related protein [Prochlorococcus sp. MIT 0602]|nr:putative PURINE PHOSPHORIBOSYLTRANSFERASE related protein [Prochlorococcus sp. MIT 0602]